MLNGKLWCFCFFGKRRVDSYREGIRVCIKLYKWLYIFKKILYMVLEWRTKEGEKKLLVKCWC